VLWKAINRVTDGAIIMAGSDMATDGRVLHHLRSAAEGTLAPDLDGTDEVTISGEPIPLRARIHTINGFSAHADQAELLVWRRRADRKHTFLTQGAGAAVNALPFGVCNASAFENVPDPLAQNGHAGLLEGAGQDTSGFVTNRAITDAVVRNFDDCRREPRVLRSTPSSTADQVWAASERIDRRLLREAQ
jgi:Zn-dependent metallo-hydrolase RNA specificity domain